MATSMDILSSTLSVLTASSTTTSTATVATTLASSCKHMAKSKAMDMGMEMSGDTCKISMLWNWYTVGACFISPQWQITSNAVFAGSCIGVVCLVMCLPLLTRLHHAFDAYIVRAHQLKSNEANRSPRPTFLQQAIKAFIHMVQFAVAYFVMLLAMYYNGYIIICILIGAFLGYFSFQWEPIRRQYETIENESASEVTHCCG